ncbi:3-dehydroquinate synthase family protein [Nannocystis sp.]|uniref:3-dehydroquinate synthase n=1 Tax=Nannocystis sp. TaxID=1962667 RepID=UPI002424EF1B|nr:3-dehydroquinate synthase family protein [Nannocystis sp.]MBK7824852.1 3-dehydroquinate synthase [Nannocystis sp.]MBK9752894.1 3-dehydroquinate synthase [Nannocystis sp.]
MHVPAESHSYPVLIGRGTIARLGVELQQRLGHSGTVALVSDSTVTRLHAAAVQANLEAQGFTVAAIVVPAGEAHKTTGTLFDVIGGMIASGLGRRDVVVALGGGVVGDLAGLAAALFMRGVPVVQCPTTLLAQVDASVGGKVAVDVPAGKNMVGAFHFPLFVVIDPELLVTLGDRELAQGLAEMLKHALLFSADHLQALLSAAPAIYARNFDIITPLVATSVGLKAACVGRDPWETGEAGKGRVLLNLGHTVGHAIEAASGFQVAHGEAVALGLRAAARISELKGLAEPGLEALVVDALTCLRLPTGLDEWLVGERGVAVERALQSDKKRAAGSVSYVALAGVGEPSVLSLALRDLIGLLRQGIVAG